MSQQKIIRAHQIRLYPNQKQEFYLKQACGTARFAYNWGLDQWEKQYQKFKDGLTTDKPSQFSLRKQLNSIKKVQYPWMLKVTKCAPQMALIQLGEAFDNFFKHRSAYPTKRKLGRDDRFTITNDQFKIKDDWFQIPKLGLVKMAEKLRFKGKLVSAKVFKVAAKWYVSITVELSEPLKLASTKKQGTVGIDLGLKTTAVLSNGIQLQSPKPYRSLLSRVKRLSRRLSKKVKKSKNWKKARIKLADLHSRIARIRLDWIHKTTTKLVSDYSTIVLENLNVKGMMRNHKLAMSISDVSLYEFRRQLEYKAPLQHCQILIADRWFPSSKTCSACGHKLDKLELSTRVWKCPECGTYHDRDHNAAKNLEMQAASYAVTVCGDRSSGIGSDFTTTVKLPSMKQKNLKVVCDQI